MHVKLRPKYIYLYICKLYSNVEIHPFKSVFLAGFPMNLIGLPAEGGKCGSLLPDGVGARGLYTRIWDSR